MAQSKNSKNVSSKGAVSKKSSRKSSTSKKAAAGLKKKELAKANRKKSSYSNTLDKSEGVPVNTRPDPQFYMTEEELAKEAERKEAMFYDVALLLIFAFSVLLFISNFGFGGYLGNALSSFFFGSFGLLGYLAPFVIFFGSCFYISNRYHYLVYRKLGGFLLTLFFLCGFMQLLMVDLSTENYIEKVYAIAASEKIGGGLAGGIQAWLFSMAFGKIGAYILVIIGLFIGIIIMTQKPVISKLRESEKNSRKLRRENRRQQRIKGHMQKRSSGSPAKEDDPPASGSDHKQDMTYDFTDLKAQRQENEDILKMDGEMKKEISVPLFAEKNFPAPCKLPETAHQPTSEDSVPSFLSEYMTRKREDLEKDFMRETADQEEALGTLLPPSQEEASDRIDAGPGQTEKNTNDKTKKERVSQEELADVHKEIEQNADLPEEKRLYHFPPISILQKGQRRANADEGNHLRATAMKLQQTLKNFGVDVTITNVSCGPSVTRYELQPEQGVKVSRIVNLTDDIKLNLAAADIRIEAPIPGKAAVGIEVPNETNSTVHLRELLESEKFDRHPSNIAFAVGKDIGGQPVVADIGKMPHLLIAGATGSGKSVCINTLIMSILFKASPEDVRMIMIDPKVVELSVYNGIPHLLIPVVTDPKKAAGALNWAVAEMTKRYEMFAAVGCRDLKGYNAKVDQLDNSIEEEKKPEKMPQIVIIVDELADLMMVAPGEVEDAICRLAQLARAAGLHLIIATQRPSVNVITGLIKANMPSRIAFSVSSGVDSRTILDMNGAEKLLGKGDMLFYPQGYQKPARVQGAFVSDEEVAKVVDFLTQGDSLISYDRTIESQIENQSISGQGGGISGEERDAYFVQAGRFIIEKDKASIGMLQRMFKIGFNRAARVMDQLADAGVVGPEEGTKPRKVLMSDEEFEKYIEDYL